MSVDFGVMNFSTIVRVKQGIVRVDVRSRVHSEHQCAPFPIMENVIEEWIREKRAGVVDCDVLN